MDSKQEFHMEEYRALKNQMVMHLSAMDTDFRFFTVGLIAVMAWIFTARASYPGEIWFGMWLPILIPVWYHIRGNWIKGKIKRIASYLIKIEMLYGEEELGWESTLKRTGLTSKIRRGSVYLMYLISGFFLLEFYFNFEDGFEKFFEYVIFQFKHFSDVFHLG